MERKADYNDTKHKSVLLVIVCFRNIYKDKDTGRVYWNYN
jgi:hypothetical protein